VHQVCEEKKGACSLFLYPFVTPFYTSFDSPFYTSFDSPFDTPFYSAVCAPDANATVTALAAEQCCRTVLQNSAARQGCETGLWIDIDWWLCNSA
jgi:hypothetical protein